MIKTFKDYLHRWPSVPTFLRSCVKVFCLYEHVTVPGLIRNYFTLFTLVYGFQTGTA